MKLVNMKVSVEVDEEFTKALELSEKDDKNSTRKRRRDALFRKTPNGRFGMIVVDASPLIKRDRRCKRDHEMECSGLCLKQNQFY